MKPTPITMAKSANIFCALQPKAKAAQPSTQAFLTKGKSNKNVKKNEHNVDKREVFQAHVVQVQTLQNELESLRAKLANLKDKSSQLASHAQHVQGSRSREGAFRSFYGLSHNAMVGEYVLSSAHNFSFTPKFSISFCPSYFTAQETSVTPRVFAIR
jgi:TolA-binding protein